MDPFYQQPLLIRRPAVRLIFPVLLLVAVGTAFVLNHADSVTHAQVATCGNSVIEAGETCDDGNNENCDSCSANCQFESISCRAATCLESYNAYQVEGPYGFTDFKAEGIYDDSGKPAVKLSWTPFKDRPQSYTVYREEGGYVAGMFTRAYRYAFNYPTTSFIDKAVAPGATYSYGMRSIEMLREECGLFAKDSLQSVVTVPLPRPEPAPLPKNPDTVLVNFYRCVQNDSDELLKCLFLSLTQS